MKPSSCKAKGRALQQAVAANVLEHLPSLSPDDVRSTSMGVAGPDLQLSTRAKELFPFGVECKAQERINIWESWAQTQRHCSKTGLTPLLVCRRNRTAPFAVLPWEFVLPLLTRSQIDAEEDTVADADTEEHADANVRTRALRNALVEALRVLDEQLQQD